MVTKKHGKKRKTEVESAVFGEPVSVSATFEPEKPSNVPEAFRLWANDVREAQSVRDRRAGRAGVGGGARWWSLVPENVKLYLLSTVAPDDFERYAVTAWASLPDGLRSAIATECRAVARAVAGCPWR